MKEVINIIINDNMFIVNEKEVVDFISNVKDLNGIEWLISLYNNFKSNKNFKNSNRIVKVAREKLLELGIELDEKGNFNKQEINLEEDIREESIVEEVSEINELPSSIIPNSFDEVTVIENDYLKVFNDLVTKFGLGEILTNSEITMLFGTIKQMILVVENVGVECIEYSYLKEFFKGFRTTYYENESSLNGFIRDAYERFMELDKNIIVSNSNGTVRKISFKSAGAASIVILIELSIIGLITFMMIS